MTLDWQTSIAAVVVVVAAAAVVRRMLMWATSSTVGGCSHCPNRGAPSPIKTLPLIQIQRPPREK